jgi:hypothetical protein
LKIVGPLSKIKPCTSRAPKIGKKSKSCNAQNFDKVKAVVGAHMKKNRNKWQTTAGNPNKDRQNGNSFLASTIWKSLSHQAS